MIYGIRTALLALCVLAAGSGAQAQSLQGFTVGEDLAAASQSRPRPSAVDEVDGFTVKRWDLGRDNAVSVTASKSAGRIIFIESDWGGDPTGAATGIPGLEFGVTKLAEIRSRFHSNGFGFRSNIVQLMGDRVVSINCYEIEGRPDLVIAFITTTALKDVPSVGGRPKPDSGEGRLDAVILANLDYLKAQWGDARLFDQAYHPIVWP